MKHSILISIISASMLLANSNIKPVEPVVEEASGKVSGQLRAFYIDRTYAGILENNRNSLAVGGWIGYDSAAWNGLTFGTKFYALEGLRIHDKSETILGAKSYDPSLYGDGFDEYGFIAEAYLNYAMGNTNLKVGRQKLNTPLAGADDVRMIPNLFEAAVLSNTDIPGTTLIAAHVTKESVGTFGNVYGKAGALSLHSGYGLGYKEATNGQFTDMAVVALGANTDTSGVTAGAVVYKGIDNLKLQAWDYYAHDILNAVYLQVDYKIAALKASAQYINQSEVGDKLAGKVDSNYWAVKLGSAIGDLSGYVAYSQTGDSDGAMHGGILSPWGGMPAFTQGMVTRHMFFADTKTTKVAASYNLKAFTDLDLKATGYYISFDVGTKATFASDTNTKETGFDIQYQATKNLNLRVRGNFPTDFKEGLDWNEYRVIANYSF